MHCTFPAKSVNVLKDMRPGKMRPLLFGLRGNAYMLAATMQGNHLKSL
jgi:hypothetical protein